MWTLPDILSVICRAFSFVLLLQAAGTALFIAAFGRRATDSLAGIRSFGCLSAIGALLFVVAHYILEPARMAGDMSGVLDPAMQALALQSPTAEAFGTRLLGLVVIALGLRLARPIVGVVGACLAALAFTLVGHTVVSPHRALLAPLLLVHLLIAAFWIGSLGSLYIASIREAPAVSARLTAAFSAMAIWLVPCIFLAGVSMTALLVPGWRVFLQPYGELLLAKTTLFALLLGLAALNRWKLGPRLATDSRAVDGFRRTVAIEYVLVCSVLTVTAVMTMFYSPEAA